MSLTSNTFQTDGVKLSMLPEGSKQMCDAAETGTRIDVTCGAERVEKLAITFDQEIALGTGGIEGGSD